MIYFLYSEFVRESLGYPEVGYSNKDFNRIGFKPKADAEAIFTFKDGKTVYMKNRFISPAASYQFTDEEKLIIALKSVLL